MAWRVPARARCPRTSSYVPVRGHHIVRGETRRSGGDAGTAAVANEKKKESSGGDGRDERQLTESFGDVEPVHHPFDHDAGHRRGFLGLILGRILNLLLRLLGLLRGGDLVRHV